MNYNYPSSYSHPSSYPSQAPRSQSYSSKQKFLFREVSKGIFEIELKYDSTVLDAKTEISKRQNFPQKSIRLIWKGKILNDLAKLRECLPKENQFFVCYVVGGSQQKQNEPNQAAKSIKITPKPKEKEVDPKVAQLMDMGFEKEQCIEALQHCNNNVEGAIEFLLTQK